MVAKRPVRVNRPIAFSAADEKQARAQQKAAVGRLPGFVSEHKQSFQNVLAGCTVAFNPVGDATVSSNLGDALKRALGAERNPPGAENYLCGSAGRNHGELHARRKSDCQSRRHAPQTE
jgi:hypothetical protein